MDVVVGGRGGSRAVEADGHPLAVLLSDARADVLRERERQRERDRERETERERQRPVRCTSRRSALPLSAAAHCAQRRLPSNPSSEKNTVGD